MDSYRIPRLRAMQAIGRSGRDRRRMNISRDPTENPGLGITRYYIVSGQSGSGRLRTTSEFSAVWQAHRDVTDCPSPARDRAAGCAIAGKGYIFGGKDGDLTWIDDTDEYTRATEAWTSNTSVSPSREYMAAVEFSATVAIVTGGHTGIAYSADTDEYANTDSWTAKTDMADARSQHAAATAGGSMYTIGGNDGSARDDIDRYDSNDSWNAESGTIAAAVSLLAAGVQNGSIYAYGGTADSDVTTNDKITPSPFAIAADTAMVSPARNNHAGGQYGNVVYAACGEAASARIADMDSFSGGTWSSRASYGTARDAAVAFEAGK